MLNYNTCMISHLLSAFAHICLSAAGIVAFITAGNPMDSPAANLTHVAVRVGGVTIHPWAGTSWYSSIPEANTTLPWGGSAIALIGVVVNFILLTFFSKLQKPGDESNQDRGLYIKIAFAASMAAHVPLVAADFTMVVFTATKTRHGGVALVAFGTLAAIAGFVALGTGIADIFFLRGLYAQTYPINTFNMPLLETDEDV